MLSVGVFECEESYVGEFGAEGVVPFRERVNGAEHYTFDLSDLAGLL